MEAAFLVRIPARSSAPEGWDSWAPSGDVLGFEPGSVRRWCTGPGARRRVEVTVHAPPAAEGGPEPSAVDEQGGIAAVVGHLRHRGRSWSAPERWAREVADLGPAPDGQALHDGLLGIFAALHVTADGDGWVSADPLAFRWLYVAERDDEVVIATRPGLAAGPDGASTDVESTGWMVALNSHLGRSTTLTGVRILEPGRVLRLAGGEPTWTTSPDPLAERPDRAPVPEVAAAIVEESAEALRAAVSLPTPSRVFELTGGKDSRFLLAIAIHAGLHHELTFETIGPPSLPDVEVATALAAALGLRHRVRFVGLRPPLSYEERTGRFVDRTYGLVNAWEAIHPSAVDQLRIGGVCGEIIRSFAPVPEECRVDGDLGRMFDHRRFDRLGLLRPDLAAKLRDELLDRLRTEPTPDADAYTRLHAHHVLNRQAGVRFGAQSEVEGTTVRHHPLYSLRNLHQALRVSGPDRESELVFAEVMRSACDLLVRQPFAAGRGWDERAVAFLAERPVGPPPPDRPAHLSPEPDPPPPVQERWTPPPATAGDDRPAPSPSATASDGGHSSLMRHLVEVARDERVRFLADSLGRAGPMAASVFDVAEAGRVLDRWDELGIADRRQLFGAATVARRLADDD